MSCMRQTPTHTPNRIIQWEKCRHYQTQQMHWHSARAVFMKLISWSCFQVLQDQHCCNYLIQQLVPPLKRYMFDVAQYIALHIRLESNYDIFLYTYYIGVQNFNACHSSSTLCTLMHTKTFATTPLHFTLISCQTFQVDNSNSLQAPFECFQKLLYFGITYSIRSSGRTINLD